MSGCNCFCGKAAAHHFKAYNETAPEMMMCNDCLSSLEAVSGDPFELISEPHPTVPESLWMDVYRGIIESLRGAVRKDSGRTKDQFAADHASQAVDHFIAKFPEWQDDKQSESTIKSPVDRT